MSSRTSTRALIREPTLSVCLITRNEEGCLPAALESVATIASEIVVTDTGSRDGTVDIAHQFGARVIVDPWQDDFSKARNCGLEAALADWILCLDADEWIAPRQEKLVRRLLSAGPDAYYVRIRSPLAGKRTGQTFVHSFERLFRNRVAFRFRGRVHEQIRPSLSAAGARIEHSGLEIEHSGYAVDETKAETKLLRNLQLLSLDRDDHPDDPLVHFHLGDTYALLGEVLQARDSYERALSMNTLPPAHRAATHQNLASVLLKTGEFERALAEAEEALRVDRQALTALLVLGSAACRLGQHECATRAVERYLRDAKRNRGGGHTMMEFEPDFARAYLIRGESRLRRGLLVNAKADAARVIRLNPVWPGGHRLMGRIRATEGAFDQAEEAFRQAVALDPDDISTWRDWVVALERAGQLGRALEVIKSALLQRRQANLYDFQAQLQIKAGDLRGAVESYRKLLELEPTCVETHRRLAGLYHKLHDPERARDHLRKLETGKKESGVPVPVLPGEG